MSKSVHIIGSIQTMDLQNNYFSLLKREHRFNMLSPCILKKKNMLLLSWKIMKYVLWKIMKYVVLKIMKYVF